MTILAWIVIGFSVAQFLVALVNLLFRQPFPEKRTAFRGLVSVMIPARNEDQNIGNILSDLLVQNYRNIEILVYDDQSTDRTAEIIREFAGKDNRIRLIPSKGLPPGWLGKNFACHSLALEAKGSYFLFLDADVRVKGDIIFNTVGHSLKNRLGLLSIFPKQIMLSPGERMTVPVMNVILLSLLPLILVQKSKFPSLAAANGQFMLFNADSYRKTLPHEKMKAQKVEDIETARWYKQLGIPLACLTGDETITCRMYTNFREAANGFAKNVTTFFGNSYLLAILFWAATTLGFIPVLLSSGFVTILVYLMILVLTRVFVSVVSRQSVLLNLIFWIPQQMALGFFIFKAILYRKNKQYQWKGRSVS